MEHPIEFRRVLRDLADKEAAFGQYRQQVQKNRFSARPTPILLWQNTKIWNLKLIILDPVVLKYAR